MWKAKGDLYFYFAILTTMFDELFTKHIELKRFPSSLVSSLLILQ